MESDYLLELDGLEQRLYDADSGESFTVCVNQPLRIARRTLVALVGPSGCGKTTLLSVLGLLRQPTAPQQLDRFIMRTSRPEGVQLEHDLKSIWLMRKRGQIESLRREHLGFALQSGELLPALTVRENIAAPLKLNGVPAKICDARVTELLESFGLEGREDEVTGESGSNASSKKPSRRNLGDQRINRLSGGEYQRVALARAIAHRPTLLFVDEPTSALNRELAYGALSQLRCLQCSSESQGAAIMITHDEQLASTFADTIVRMAPRRGEPVGELVEITSNTPAINRDELPAAESVHRSATEAIT